MCLPHPFTRSPLHPHSSSFPATPSRVCAPTTCSRGGSCGVSAGESRHRPLTLPLAARVASAVGRVDYVRAKVEAGTVTPIATSGASILSSTVTADGFVLVPPERDSLAAGELVEVYLYEG